MKKNLIPVIVVLVILVFGLGGFIIYDKLLNNKESENNNLQIENKFDNIPDEIGNNTESEIYFLEYLNYIPLRYVNSNLSDYSMSNLTKREISMSIWRYIWNNSNNYSSNASERKMSEKEINIFLNKFFNFTNYAVEEMQIKDDFVFGLEKNNGYYVASSVATDYSFANFDIKDIKYDENPKMVIITADNYYLEMGSSEKKVISEVIIELKKNDNNFNMISFKVNK